MRHRRRHSTGATGIPRAFLAEQLHISPDAAAGSAAYTGDAEADMPVPLLYSLVATAQETKRRAEEASAAAPAYAMDASLPHLARRPFAPYASAPQSARAPYASAPASAAAALRNPAARSPSARGAPSDLPRSPSPARHQSARTLSPRGMAHTTTHRQADTSTMSGSLDGYSENFEDEDSADMSSGAGRSGGLFLYGERS
jgi:pyruvate/2-oxoglutarate dehydrogenase complex dihydrolipoamide acyltransferase (E2) component